MMWQRVCLAAGFALGCALPIQQAAAQADIPDAGSQAPVVAPQADDTGTPPAHVDHSSHVPTNTVGPKVIVDVNLTTQRMHVTFPDGSEETWPVASGRPGLDTPDGQYKPQWIDPDHVSKEYQDAPMPYAIFFDLKGHAIHGSYEKTFGRAVSHGCVRLPVKDAKKLFEAVKVSGAEIDITGRAPRKGGTVWARRQTPPRYADAQQNQYGYGYGHPGSYGYGYYQRNGYPPRTPYRPPQQSFFGALFGGD
ncbi:MAG: murein L,D-transpeptidase [Beijerinckiaceae bacterium]|nr:MAG: murein L,D-transpeptidase [Beijerinckiaceae bacterium]